MQVTSIFSLSHNVFKKLLLTGCGKQEIIRLRFKVQIFVFQTGVVGNDPPRRKHFDWCILSVLGYICCAPIGLCAMYYSIRVCELCVNNSFITQQDLTLMVPSTEIIAFAGSEDQDQAAVNMQPDLRSTLYAMLKHYCKKISRNLQQSLCNLL